jgi:hypothetical protein
MPDTTNTEELVAQLERAAMGYAQDRSEHTERRLSAARKALIEAQAAELAQNKHLRQERDAARAALRDQIDLQAAHDKALAELARVRKSERENEDQRLRSERQGEVKQCHGAADPDCDYLAVCGHPCNKCGKTHRPHVMEARAREYLKLKKELAAERETTANLVRALREESGFSTFMGEPVLPVAQPPREPAQPLSNEEITAAWESAQKRNFIHYIDFARAIERLITERSAAKETK